MAGSVKVGLKGLVFEAIHYTPEAGGAPILHGHTFRIDVEVEGPLDENGMVVDFRLLRDTVTTIISAWDMSVIIPSGSEFQAHGVFTYKVKRIPYHAATTEYIAMTIASELRRALCERIGEQRCRNMTIRVRVWESVDRYAEVESAPNAV